MKVREKCETIGNSEHVWNCEQIVKKKISLRSPYFDDVLRSTRFKDWVIVFLRFHLM